MIRLVAAFAVVALAACGPPAPTAYPSHYEYNFMQSCLPSEQAPGVCACAWRRIVAEVSPADFEAFELMSEAQRVAHPLYQQFLSIRAACVAEAAGTTGAVPR